MKYNMFFILISCFGTQILAMDTSLPGDLAPASSSTRTIESLEKYLKQKHCHGVCLQQNFVRGLRVFPDRKREYPKSLEIISGTCNITMHIEPDRIKMSASYLVIVRAILTDLQQSVDELHMSLHQQSHKNLKAEFPVTVTDEAITAKFTEFDSTFFHAAKIGQEVVLARLRENGNQVS